MRVNDMVPFSEYFRSVEHIWVLWLLANVLLVWLVRRLLAGFTWRRLGELATGEQGAAYSLVYVMTVPIFVMVVALVCEMTLILMAKMGATYAAYCAARAGVVWSVEGDSRFSERMNLAARQAMVPFASSWPEHVAGPGPKATPGNDTNYFATWSRYAALSGNSNIYSGYLRRKYLYAWKATSVTSQGVRTAGSITAQVNYNFAMHSPMIARIIGAKFNGQFYVYPIQAQVTLPNEWPRPANLEQPNPSANNPAGQPLGISYHSSLE
jgi:hypothetical protein